MMLLYICHGRKSSLVESVEVQLEFLPVETPTGRNSNQGDLGIALGSEI